MILVTVGTHNQPFDRLLKEIDRLVEQEEIKDKVIAQIGYSKYKPRNYQYFTFTSWKKILKLNNIADIIITHGGAGNLILASHINKPIVVVPRMKHYGEHVDNHQLQLVRELEKQGRVIAVYDINELGKAVKKAKSFKSGKRSREKERRIVSIVRHYIEDIAKSKED